MPISIFTPPCRYCRHSIIFFAFFFFRFLRRLIFFIFAATRHFAATLMPDFLFLSRPLDTPDAADYATPMPLL